MDRLNITLVSGEKPQLAKVATDWAEGTLKKASNQYTLVFNGAVEFDYINGEDTVRLTATTNTLMDVFMKSIVKVDIVPKALTVERVNFDVALENYLTFLSVAAIDNDSYDFFGGVWRNTYRVVNNVGGYWLEKPIKETTVITKVEVGLCIEDNVHAILRQWGYDKSITTETILKPVNIAKLGYSDASIDAIGTIIRNYVCLDRVVNYHEDEVVKSDLMQLVENKVNTWLMQKQGKLLLGIHQIDIIENVWVDIEITHDI